MLTKPSISLPRTALLFGIPTLLLYVILTNALPYMQTVLNLHAALSWFIGGTVVFGFMLLLAVGLSSRQTPVITLTEIRLALRLMPLSRRDWKYSLIGLALVFAGMGFIFGITYILHRYLDLPMLDMTPAALKFPPFQGQERWLLVAWGVMFFFNIVGEECLWRGYILQRQIPELGRMAWLVNGAFWALFHLPFGLSMIILASPAFVVVPYVFQQTRNTNTGIVIHGLMNGPIFVVISLGLVDPSVLM